ncbi:MAG: hypothetical protein P1V97_03725 [Planctomycetota bacterium]|nr:hypothetical protein [Planctomycetota bacterium]
MDNDLGRLRRSYDADPGNDQLLKVLLQHLIRLGNLDHARSLVQRRYVCKQAWSDLKRSGPGEGGGGYDTNYCESCRRYVTLPENENDIEELIDQRGCYAMLTTREGRSLDWLVELLLRRATPLPNDLCIVKRQPRLFDEMYDSEFMTSRLKNCELSVCGYFGDLGMGMAPATDFEDPETFEAERKRVFDDPAFILRGYTRYIALHRIKRRNEIRFLAIVGGHENLEEIDNERRLAIEADEADPERAVFK